MRQRAHPTQYEQIEGTFKTLSNETNTKRLRFFNAGVLN
jgi:hypothetical protein